MARSVLNHMSLSLGDDGALVLQVILLPDGGMVCHVLSPRSQFALVPPAGSAGSLVASAAAWAVDTGLFASLVLSTLDKPTAALSSVASVLLPRMYWAVVPVAMMGSKRASLSAFVYIVSM